jgi:probable dihydroxyacetone kinase regulator
MVHASQTKAKLADSLKDLMKKTPFRKITIQNVTDHCGLNRQTFYYHFKDMYDLLRWIYQNEIFRDFGLDRNWKNTLLTTLKYAKKNKVFLRNTVRSLRKESIERFLYPFVFKWASRVFDEACSGLFIRQEDRNFLVKFFSHAFLDAILIWVGNGMPESESHLLQRVTMIRDMVRLYEQSQSVPDAAAVFPLMQKLRSEQNYL